MGLVGGTDDEVIKFRVNWSNLAPNSHERFSWNDIVDQIMTAPATTASTRRQGTDRTDA